MYVVAVQETHFICAADSQVLENDFVVFQNTRAAVALGYGDRLVVAEVAVKSFEFRFMRPVSLWKDALSFDDWGWVFFLTT